MKRIVAACVLTALMTPWVKGDQTALAEGSDQSLFNGVDLTGWSGDKRFWRVEDGAIVGQTSKDNPAPHNTFLSYSRREFSDFVLSFKYKVEGFNSGMQYRSVQLDDYMVKGLQADFEAQWHDGNIDKFTGMFFEEGKGGRMFMGQRGDAVLVESGSDGKPQITKIGKVGDQMELAEVIHREDWNEYTIIAKGFAFTHIVNGRVMSIGYDEDEAHRRASGIIALQLHSGTPMKIQVKDVVIREL